jgi:hypothetical protein
VGEAIEQRDEADKAKHIGALQLIPSVLRTALGSRGYGRSPTG